MQDDSGQSGFRHPNYCPFCAAHTVNGGTGDHHGDFVCGKCHALYSIQFFGARPAARYEQSTCDEEYIKHRDKFDMPPGQV